MEMTPDETKIAGVDEVGKGCLFGPVFAGAVIFDKDAGIQLLKAGLKDSKTLSPKRRALLVPLIKQKALAWGIGDASSQEIDSKGIRIATELAMIRALKKLTKTIDLVLVDGVLPIRTWNGPQKTLIKGETKSPAIAAASVLAKEARDELIKGLAITYPDYGLSTNVGYGTKLHIKVLQNLGPTPLHRKSFLSKICV